MWLRLVFRIADEAIGQLRREGLRLLDGRGLKEAGRNLHAEVLLPVFSFTEVAEQRQQRTNLTAFEGKVNAVDVLATLFKLVDDRVCARVHLELLRPREHHARLDATVR
jgi:hypothetical protein